MSASTPRAFRPSWPIPPEFQTYCTPFLPKRTTARRSRTTNRPPPLPRRCWRASTTSIGLVHELIRVPSWSSDSFGKLAQQFGLMPAGALESVNEWAFERFDEALLEEADEFEINPSIAAQLAV